ncbi:hypothetical protein ABU162_26685 [Paenibacillus thiaminolyticus]|uniref:hypothetical protein n=1 Tax=Paenibacillus thiaminolyticus TaxID=49283 RepID=UPI0035A70D87
MNQFKNPLSVLLEKRSSVIEIFVIAFLLGAGVNMLSTGLTTYSWIESNSLYIGASIILVSLIYLLVRLFSFKNIIKEIRGFIVHNESQNSLVSVPHYEMSEDISRYLDSAFIENKAIKNQWEKEPLGWERSNGKSHKLITEAVEYFVISHLSTHLIDYFNGAEFNDKRTEVFARENLPDVLLTNRFFELFSAPLENREHFSELLHDDNIDQIYGAYAENGAYYERFELHLPSKSNVLRKGIKNILIRTKRFNIELDIDFDGSVTNLPRKFAKLYLKSDNFLELNCFSVDIEIQVKFKLSSIFSLSGWHYYKWIDSFLKSLEEGTSKDVYFNKINWETVLTLVETNENINSLKPKKTRSNS